MWDTIKKCLFKIGWLEPKTTIDKANYLLTIDIDLYNQYYRFITIEVTQPDIIKYLNKLKQINNHNLTGETILRETLYDNPGKNTTISEWNTDNSCTLDKNHFKDFLKEAIGLTNTYHLLTKLTGNHIASSNSIKLQTYIINIDSIINIIYNTYKHYK